MSTKPVTPESLTFDLTTAMDLLDRVRHSCSAEAEALKLILQDWHAALAPRLTASPASEPTNVSAFNVSPQTIKARCGTDTPFALRRCAQLADAGRLRECYASMLAVSLQLLIEMCDDMDRAGFARIDAARVPEWLPVCIAEGSPLRTALDHAVQLRVDGHEPKRLLLEARVLAELGAAETLQSRH